MAPSFSRKKPAGPAVSGGANGGTTLASASVASAAVAPPTPAKKKTSKMKRLLHSASRRGKKSGGASSSTGLHDSHESDLIDEEAGSTSSSCVLDEIAVRLRADIEVRDRKFRLQVYPRCFVGSEAVDYLVEKYGDGPAPTRREAVDLGRRLMTRQHSSGVDQPLFEHVTRERNFEDACKFVLLSQRVDSRVPEENTAILFIVTE